MTQSIRDCVIGFDTSAYTTSVAAVTRDLVIFQQRQLLKVPPSQRGLRPQEAVFEHVQNMPALIENLVQAISAYSIRGICVSEKPRPLPTSYLPPFSVGLSFARSLAYVYGVPLSLSTHQEGHIQAALWSIGHEEWTCFSALHISGGTTELLQIRRQDPGHFVIQRIGGTDDLYAGQLVDRVGVMLGLPFPAGPHLQALARHATDPLMLTVPRVWHDGTEWKTSFSGPETQARRAYEQGAAGANIARGVELVLARTLARLIERAVNIWPLVVVGGVAANETLRQELIRHTSHPQEIFFASPDLSRDNAVGIARIGYQLFNS
ncbi:hypothetical protein [Sulfobacillus thermosulfidooxidans]|uniref:hypothetical protein n=1 Tax=Sulfobacillus thermosulfidooxidans TaxID=28034 RepID=UPI0006B513AD|nr:hypothetical protein [Sulfobacillus thermosulfidooxidans]